MLVLGMSTSARASQPFTTGPITYLHIHVSITDTRLRLSSTTVVRAQTVYFDVVNYGKLRHNFSISGQQTPALRHAQAATVVVAFSERGRYRYECSLNCTKTMRGSILVTAPPAP